MDLDKVESVMDEVQEVSSKETNMLLNPFLFYSTLCDMIISTITDILQVYKITMLKN